MIHKEGSRKVLLAATVLPAFDPSFAHAYPSTPWLFVDVVFFCNQSLIDRSCYVAQASLEFKILLAQSPQR